MDPLIDSETHRWDDHKSVKKKLLETKQLQSEIVEIIRSHQTRAPEVEEKQEQLKFSFAVIAVMEHLGNRNFKQAEKEALEALRIAQSLEEEISVARGHYWLGRIDFEKGNLKSAYSHFMAARPCVMNDECPEGQTLQFYLGLSKKGISESYRRRVLLEYSRAVLDGYNRTPLGDSGQQEPSEKSTCSSTKRKRESSSYKLVLRPVSYQLSSDLSKQQARRSKEKTTKQTKVWETRDNDEFFPHRQNTDILENQQTEQLSATEDSQMGPKSTDRVAPTNARPRVPQSQFTLRCWPKGITSRTRPTEIFTTQFPGEDVLSVEDWDVVRQFMKDRPVTLSYLARERQNTFKD
ncbi:hypothetical protein N7462_004886 [Penicillium macrosclerotiorum]|uniref:uncharacterized protein n=1 Tax=Penicillium macrosclerotiorum TaxID=303699 RepID=UPI002549612B|nr:uncharacterized protein N7462_004886 [Penicillium macrosclerotiorum]KAJ5690494.1 hypothetical protein N7462_004886 [Penicillium macrosclerotiorum]